MSTMENPKSESMAFESDVLKPHGFVEVWPRRIQAWMHISSWNVCDNNWRSGMGGSVFEVQRLRNCLGGGFNYFLFSSLLGEDFQFD